MDAEAWDERYAATELVWSAGPNQFVEAECADLAPGRGAHGPLYALSCDAMSVPNLAVPISSRPVLPSSCHTINVREAARFTVRGFGATPRSKRPRPGRRLAGGT